MRLKLATGVLFTTALFFAGCAKKGPPSFEADEFKKDKAAVAKRYVKADNLKARQKQPKKAFIPLFQVEFINQSSASSASYSMGSKNSSNLHVTYKLEGVDTAAFVALVDNLYADFADKLKAAGYDVIPKDVIVHTPQYGELKARAEKTNPIEKSSRLEGKNKALVVAPTDMAIAYLNTLNPAPSLKSIWAGIKGELPESPLAHLIDSTQAVAVCVQMVVGFAQLKDTHVKGSGNSSVSSEYRFCVANMHTLVGFEGQESVSKAGKASRWNIVARGPVARLSKPMFGDNGFATGTRDITSVGAKAVEGIANALSIMGSMSTGGGSVTSKSRIYALDVNKDKYLTTARDNLGYANEMLLVSLQ